MRYDANLMKLQRFLFNGFVFNDFVGSGLILRTCFHFFQICDQKNRFVSSDKDSPALKLMHRGDEKTTMDEADFTRRFRLQCLVVS